MSGVAHVMNQSLSPTRLDPSNPLSPSNYPDKKSVVAAYKRTVMMILESPEDRANLQRALKEFRGTLLVEDLMECLKPILNQPKQRQLYLALRPLIPARVRAEYNSHIPYVPSFEKKVVHLKQQGSRSLGFNIRGGKEFRCGVYVTAVLPSSRAAQSGLKVGDELLRINGLTLSESTHEEVVNILRLKKTLTLTLRVVGMIPDQDCFGNIEWKTVGEKKGKFITNPTHRLNTAILRSTKKIQVSLDESNVLGASIKTSSDPQSGVYITELIPNSVAHNAGLKIGDEIIEVNGQSLLNKPHQDSIKILKSSHSLMFTIRNKDPTGITNSGHHDALINPPEDFELSPHDFDIDAELIPSGHDVSLTGFVLKQKVTGEVMKRNNQTQAHNGGQNVDRLSLLDMQMQRSTNAPVIASPAAFGHGPAVSMPTLMGMMPEMASLDDSVDAHGDSSLLSVPAMSVDGTSPKHNARESAAFPDMYALSEQTAVIPPSIANVFPSQQGEFESVQDKHADVISAAQKRSLCNPEQTALPAHKPVPPPVLPKPQQHLGPGSPQGHLSHNSSGAKHSSFQFPVDDDEEEEENDAPERHIPTFDRQPHSSAMKKASPTTTGDSPGKKKTPAFNESVEIIKLQGDFKSQSTDNLSETVHPSNMEFSDAVLQGRTVDFHTIPKDGPIKIAIRGGTDTPLGGSIIISRILEGGAADRYGRLNVGDQILVCDGVSLIDVTHNEAAQALKRAMDMESNSIDLVVAINPDVEQFEEEQRSSPRTMWPPPVDTLCEDQPASSTQFDYAKSSRRAHSGFTMRGKDKVDAAQTTHAFLPRAP